jgi:arylsulfatase A-like enzyme
VAENTLVIFTSDNGSHWLPSDIEKFGHRANAHWRGQKADIWEAGHRVPFVVRWPGQVKAESRSDATICLIDVLATLAEITGAKLPENAGEDSHSFLVALRGEPFTRPAAVVHHSGDGHFAIRSGDWKLATSLGSGGFSAPKSLQPKPDGPQGQLYNLKADPGELTNLWLQEPEKVKEMTKLLAEYQEQGRSR